MSSDSCNFIAQTLFEKALRTEQDAPLHQIAIYSKVRQSSMHQIAIYSKVTQSSMIAIYSKVSPGWRINVNEMSVVVSAGVPSFPQLYSVLRPSGLDVTDILALCNAMTVALNVSR